MNEPDQSLTWIAPDAVRPPYMNGYGGVFGNDELQPERYLHKFPSGKLHHLISIQRSVHWMVPTACVIYPRLRDKAMSTGPNTLDPDRETVRTPLLSPGSMQRSSSGQLL